MSQLLYTGDYSYEFYGLATPLVQTALTEKCFLTMTQALSLHNMGLSQGPAGTGKSETVKELAKALGRQCIVQNCSLETNI